MHKEIRTKQVKSYFVVLEKENISLISVFIFCINTKGPT